MIRLLVHLVIIYKQKKKKKKTSLYTVFITSFHFAVRKNIRLKYTHYFIMKIPNKRELQ